MESHRRVVGDVKHDSLREAPSPQAYFSYQQFSWTNWYVVIRATAEPTALIWAVKQEFRKLDDRLAVYQAQTMEQVVTSSVWQQRLFTWLFSVFGGLALLLAGVGVASVIAQVVAQRRREIGVRLALGAKPGDVVRTMFGRAFSETLLGLALGLALSLALSQLLASQLYGVDARDPLTLGGAALFLAGASALACYLPARAAAEVDPMAALRDE